MEAQKTDINQLFKIDISPDLVLHAPSDETKRLEKIFSNDEKFYMSPPKVEDDGEYQMKPGVLIQKQQAVREKHLNDSLSNYQMTKNKFNEHKKFLERKINDITQPLSCSDDPQRKAAGFAAQALGLQISKQRFSKEELLTVIDGLIMSENTDALGMLGRLYDSRKAGSQKELEVLKPVREKLNAYFSKRPLGAYTKEMEFCNHITDIIDGRISQITSKQQFPMVNIQMR